MYEKMKRKLGKKKRKERSYRIDEKRNLQSREARRVVSRLVILGAILQLVSNKDVIALFS